MSNIRKYYFHLLRRNLFSWRMLSVLIITVLTMDSFLSGIQAYCRGQNIKMSQWGFALLWNNKYLTLCFLLIYLYAIANMPESRSRERYAVSRIGVSKWITAQSLYLITFGWLYTAVLSVLPNILLWKEISMMENWGKGWATLANVNMISHYGMYVKVSHYTISNKNPLQANCEIFLILGLLLGCVGLISFVWNFYSKIISSLALSFLVLLSFAAEKNTALYRFSPVSWVDLDNHYSVLRTNFPRIGYMISMLLGITLLCYFIAKYKVGQTQENNRRK